MNRHDVDKAFCVSAAAHMRTLLARRDFVGAVQCYEAQQSQIATEVGSVEVGEILHLAAQAYASLTNYTAALKAARLAQALMTKAGDSLMLAEVFVTLGGILRDRGELAEAQKAYRDAESIFRRNDCPEGQSRALNHLAGLYFRLADYRNALAVLMDAVVIARRLDDRRKLAFMMGNIGRLHTFMGDFAEAERHLLINIEMSSDLGDDLETMRAQLSLGYVYLQQAEFEHAEEMFGKAGVLLTAVNSPRDEVIYLTYLGELQYRTGEFDLSGSVLRKALAKAETIAPGTTLAGRVMRHLAELAVRTGDFRLARKIAARATVIMERVDERVELGALKKIMAQVTTGNSDDLGERQAAEARQLFQRAIDILDESGVRWEKAEALTAAGSSPVFTERQRLTYLFRAEEFYSRNRIRNKQDEISRLINALGRFTAESSSSAAVTNRSEFDYLTRCPALERIKKQLPLLSRSDLPVLITGETGVGKDHLARYYHSLVRPDGPFVAVNCASVPENLLESELFGFRKGAFTGADHNKPGLFEAANGGVFLLDEIGDLPLGLQAKLLGVLESRRITPLGSTRQVEIDIILVAATNRDLEAMVEQGTFRRDLYYRLSGITLHLPPLRRRKEDIPLLVEHFTRKRGLLGPQQRVSPELVQQFLAHDWPGNIRELDNVINRLSLMSQSVADGQLHEVVRSILSPEQAADHSPGLFERVELFERQLITEALLAAGGNKSEAARILGIHEATVRTKLKRYGISLEGSMPD
ncbi:MAG: sigma 54-interacting transcriptional regulator [Candidatus Zixiibacteriota bacterium]